MSDIFNFDSVIPATRMEEIQNLEMTVQELQTSAERSLIDMGSDPTDEDESEVQDMAARTDDTKEEEFDFTAFVEDVPTASTPPQTSYQMTKEKLNASVIDLSEKLKAVRTEKPRPPSRAIVESWSHSRGYRLEKRIKDSLVEVLEHHPGLTEDTMEGFLLGWSARGDSNLIEVRNVHQSMQEALNNNLASNSGFKREAEALLTGFKESQKVASELLQELNKIVTGQLVPTLVPTRQAPRPQPAQSPQAPLPVDTTPKGTRNEKMNQILKILGKRHDSYQPTYSVAKLAKALGTIVDGLRPEDWGQFSSMMGRLSLNKILEEELRKP